MLMQSITLHTFIKKTHQILQINYKIVLFFCIGKKIIGLKVYIINIQD